MQTFNENALVKSLSSFWKAKVAKIKPVLGGYTIAKRYVVKFEDGNSIFAKVAVNNDTADWLRAEYNFYKQSKFDFHPKLLGWKDQDDETFLLLEDLSEGDWSNKWTDQKVQAVFNSLKDISEVKPPNYLPQIKELHSDLFCWEEIEKAPSIFIDSGLAKKNVLEKSFERIKSLADLANIEGASLVHMDIRSDNICFIGDRAIFVDWNHACIGNPKLDTLFWLPSLYLEGGSAPWEFNISEPKLTALILGYFAYNASLEAPHSGSKLRDFQYKQMQVVFEWLKKMGVVQS